MMSSLLLQWKEEPVSPLSSEESLVSEDVDLYESIFLDEKVDLELIPCESKAVVATKLLEDLEQLGDLDEYIKEEDIDDLIKDEPFSNWLDEGKIFENVGVACSAPQPIAPAQHTTPPSVLWQEFENVLYTTMPQGTLTPPQSPPNFVTLETIPNSIFTSSQKFPVQEQSFLNEVLSYNQPTIDLQTDVAHELAVVDELIRTRAENLIDCPLSPGSNTSCSSSNFGDCSSDDPEWIPDSVESSKEYEPCKILESRKRAKPYSRAPNEDRKSRKKEQNKNAATRYRMKKKAEVEEILKEEGTLAKENEELENEINKLQREIKYLKSLMRDVFKAKGLLN
ncbi:hypothetical protein FQR65_LT12098 [Abscondita terminalis]|nr:hypothetical protein FQR65_LT12098 [Abscondita terminalis]